MRIPSIFISCFLLIASVHAQGDARWCEIEAPEMGRPSSHLTVAEHAPQVADIAPLPPNSEYKLWYQGEVKISADGTRAVTSIRDKDTWKEELVGVNLEDETIYFRLSAEEIEALRPPTDEPYYEGVLLRAVDWMGNSHRLALQTQYICHNCGEGAPPPDDLHVIDEQGSLTTFLDGEESAILSISPDGAHVLFGGVTNISLLRVEDAHRRDHVVPDYHADVSPYGLPVLYARWESAESALVFSHTTDFEELTAPVEIWRVNVDNRPPELVRAFIAVFERAAINADTSYAAYARVTGPANHDELDLVIQDLATGEESVVGTVNPWRTSTWFWTANPEQFTLYYTDTNADAHYLALCEDSD